MTDRPEAPQGTALEPIERIVSLILSSGMAITFICYAIGLILLFLRKEVILNTSQQYYHSLAEFLQSIGSGDAEAFLYLGTVFLILTPFVLVMVSIFTFLKQRDRRFAFIAALVLMIMIASVIVGSVFKVRI